MEKRRRAGLILVRAMNPNLARAIKDILEEGGYEALVIAPGERFPEDVDEPILGAITFWSTFSAPWYGDVSKMFCDALLGHEPPIPYVLLGLWEIPQKYREAAVEKWELPVDAQDILAVAEKFQS